MTDLSNADFFEQVFNKLIKLNNFLHSIYAAFRQIPSSDNNKHPETFSFKQNLGKAIADISRYLRMQRKILNSSKETAHLVTQVDQEIDKLQDIFRGVQHEVDRGDRIDDPYFIRQAKEGIKFLNRDGKITWELLEKGHTIETELTIILSKIFSFLENSRTTSIIGGVSTEKNRKNLEKDIEHARIESMKLIIELKDIMAAHETFAFSGWVAQLENKIATLESEILQSAATHLSTPMRTVLLNELKELARKLERNHVR